MSCSLRILGGSGCTGLRGGWAPAAWAVSSWAGRPAGGVSRSRSSGPNLAENPDFRARFAREASAARKVSGIFIAPVVDADLDGPVPWLATAYVAAPSLADAVAERGPMPTASVLRLAAGLAEGLAAIHFVGVVHRGLKPTNVFWPRTGRH